MADMLNILLAIRMVGELTALITRAVEAGRDITDADLAAAKDRVTGAVANWNAAVAGEPKPPPASG